MGVRRTVLAMILGVLALLGGPAAADIYCNLEAEPPSIPNGAHAGEAEMQAAMDSLKSYQAALEPYRACLDKIVSEPSVYSREERAQALDLHNLSVEVESGLVEIWALEVAKYKQRADVGEDG